MRTRALLLIAIMTAVALFAATCGGGGRTPAADRSVDGSWDAATAALRTQVVEKALEDGLSRAAAGCMVDSAGIGLERLLDIDLSARTGSRASAAEAETLATALATCGPSPTSMLAARIPGVLEVPATHAAPAECFVNAYVDALVESYTDRFTGRTRRGPHEPDLRAALRACDAAGALVLGASNSGHPEVASLTTLEWECLVDRLPSSDFEPLFPFPDDRGDARDRLEPSSDDDVAYCEAWVAGTPVEG